LTSSLARYLIRRSLQSALILLLVSMLSFGIMRIAPGGPAQFYDDPQISPAVREQMLESFGLNDPMPIQYAKWLGNLFRLELGYSFIDRRPVAEKIAERIPATFQLSLTAFVMGLLGIPLGIYAALHRGHWQDQVIRVFTVVGNALPHWWLGLILLVVLGSWMSLVPLGGMFTVGNDTLANRLWHLALPSFIGALGGWISLSRFVRSELLDVLGQDYIRSAHAKGLEGRVVLYSHALRNALLPLVTMFGGVLAGLFSGGVLFEITFSWPGLGRMAVDAAYQRDYPVLMALNMFGAALVIVGYLLADIAYGWADPRVRYS
jgi:peptide/nickel transport system permease protein